MLSVSSVSGAPFCFAKRRLLSFFNFLKSLLYDKISPRAFNTMREVFLYPQLRVDRSVETSGKQALQFLTWFKGQLEPLLDAYFAEKIKEAADINPEVVGV